MKTPLCYRNPIPVAAHRGNAEYFPENTMASFRSALSLSPDMIETDLHMTKDGELVIMHDHDVRRTTNGTGLIREKTLEEMRSLDAGYWKAERFRGEKVPTFREFLDLLAPEKDLLFNVELKDYPADSGDFALRSCDRAIAMMDEYGITDRSVVNTWSGELNEYIADRYGDRVRIHAYDHAHMGLRQKRYVLDYAYCVCLFTYAENPVADAAKFKLVKDYGVEPWVYYKTFDPAVIDLAVKRGARLFTANDPARVMEHLRGMGLHE